MALFFKLDEHLLVVEVCVTEQPVESSDHALQVLLRAGLDVVAGLEVLGVVELVRRVVQAVGHVVDGRAVLGLGVAGAQVQPHVGGFHFGAGLGGALSVVEQVNDQ